jgi:hypothetical protein
MARGGPRPGAGRKPGSPSRVRKPLSGDSARVGRHRSPLQYLLDLMNDESADELRRDRAAQALLPFCHARPVGQPSSYNYVSKKEQAARDAAMAGYGTDWWPLLHPDRALPQCPPAADAPQCSEPAATLPPTDWGEDLDPSS